MINRIVLAGRLGRDPELRTTTTGKSVANFSLAVDKRFKPDGDGPSCDWFNVVAWGKTAEFVANYLTKGRLVAVDGRMETRKYTAADGSEKTAFEVVAESVQGLDRPTDENTAPKQAAHAEKAGAATSGLDEYDPFADD